MPEPSTIAVPSRDADIAVFVGDNAVASPQAPRRSGRWTDLFRLVTRAGTPGSDAAPQLFVLDEPAAIQLDQPHARAPRGVAATNADQLARDIAEIQIVRDRLFASPARGTAPAPAAPARTSDYVPILVGVVIAFTSMVVFGAAASFVSLR